jgi:hypothetical protein
MNTSNDYAVTVKIRNGRILSRMGAKGIKTLPELAQKAGMSYKSLWEIVSLKKRPVGVRGNWVAGLENVAGVLGCDVDDLFTDAQRESALEKNSGEIYLDEPEVMALTAGDPEREYMIKTEARRLLDTLTKPRTRDIVTRRLVGETLDEIGTDYGISKDRVRQIEEKAYRTMRTVAARAGFKRLELGDAL